MAASVALLDWYEAPVRTVQDADWVLEDRTDSTNQLRVTTSLAEADGVMAEQEVIFKGRRFRVSQVDRDRSQDRAVITADEAQAALADLVIMDFKPNNWTLTRAMNAVLEGTRWSLGEVNGTRYGQAHFDEITALDALHFLARHQDAHLSFDSLRRRVNITRTSGTRYEYVFTYGRQLINIEKDIEQPRTTVIYPTMAEDVALPLVEDYGYYHAQGLSTAEAKARFKKEDYWEDSRYEIAENMTRDAEKRLAEEAYPKITYTLHASATLNVDGVDDFDLADLRLGDQVYVWDQEIDAKLRAEVSAVTTSSDQSQNVLTLAYLPDSLGASVPGRYFGDSGRPSSDGRRRSGPQPRPSMPILEEMGDYGIAVTRWNGQDHDGNYNTIPQRFGTLLTLVAPLEEDGSIPSPMDSSHTFMGSDIETRGGGTSTIGFNGFGKFAIWHQMRGWDGETMSQLSEPLVVDVPPVFDPGPLQESLTDLNENRLPALRDRLDNIEPLFDDYDDRIQSAQDGAQSARDTAEDLRDNVLPPLQGELVDLRDERLPAVEGTLDQTRLGMENLRDVRLPDLQDTLHAGIDGLADDVLATRHLFVGNTSNIWLEAWHGLDAPGVYTYNPGSMYPFGTAMNRYNQSNPPASTSWMPVVHPHKRRGWQLRGDAGNISLAFRVGVGRGIPVTPGERYALQCWVRDTAAESGLFWYMYFYNQDGTEAGPTTPEIAMDLRGIMHDRDNRDGVTFQFEIPDLGFDQMFMVPYLRHFTSASSEWRTVMEPKLRKMVDGHLVVDGSISARHIMAESIAAAVGEFLHISAEQIDTENLAAYLATIIELDAGQITSGRINTSRLNAEEVAGAVANFLTLDALEINFEQLAGEIANIIEITAESIQAGAIGTRHLAIADFENILTEDALWDFRENGVGSRNWTSGGGNAAGWLTFANQAQGPVVLRYDAGAHSAATSSESALRYAPTGNGVQVTPGDSFHVSADTWLNSGSAGYLRLRARYTDDDGNNVVWTDIGDIATGTGTTAHSWTVPADDRHRRMDLTFWADPGGTGNAHIGRIRFRRMHGGELIVDGAIKARNLDAEEIFFDQAIGNTIAAGVGEFLELNADQIRSNSWTGITATGATFQTHAAANRGVKMLPAGLRGWDNNGNLNFDLSASTGNLLATGTFRTAQAGSRVEVYNDSDGGRVEFHHGNARARMKLMPALNRLELVYNPFGDTDQERPHVGVEDQRAFLGYRQTQIEVGGTTQTNQGIWFNGTIRGTSQFRGLIHSEAGARHLFTDANNRTLAYIGQRPESGQSSEFEIRIERGALRVSDSSIRARGTYLDTVSGSANMQVQSTGWYARVSSASRYKLDQRELTVPDSLLDVPVIDWVDKAATEYKAKLDAKPRPFVEDDQEDYDAISLRRIPGVVAETVEEYGGEQFVTYGPDGQVEEVMYDRLALAQIQILKRRIEALEGAS